MARKKANQARDAAESGEDTSAVLTEERAEDTSSTTATGTGDSVSLDKRASDEEPDAVDTDAAVDTDDEDDVTESSVDEDHDDTEDDDDRSTPGSAVAEDDLDDDDLDADDDLDDDDFDDEDDERSGFGPVAFFTTLGVAVVAVLGVLFLLAAFVWPAFLGPGSPEGTGNDAVSALQAKDPGRLGQISCVRLDGSPAAAFPPELLSLIGNAAPAGAPKQTLDTEARVPVDLTLTQGGQSQTLPADLLLGVTGGDWCLNGISQRQ